MDEIDKLLQHVTDNCDQIVDSIKQDEAHDDFNEKTESLLKQIDEMFEPAQDEEDEEDEEDDNEEKWLQNSYDSDEQSETPPHIDIKHLENIVNQLVSEARDIDDTIMEMIADGEIELFKKDGVVMMKLTPLGLKKHEEDEKNREDEQ